MDYKHGAYSEFLNAGSRVAENALAAMVYVGTAPVHTLDGGSGNVNRPVLVRSASEARKYFGYSDDWAKYTLMEAVHAHFELNGVGPIVLINVMDPATHRAESKTSKSSTFANKKILYANAETVILDTVTVKNGSNTLVKGTDYLLAYDWRTKTLTITYIGSAAVTTVTVEYYEAVPEDVDASDVIGSDDGAGLRTGLYAIRNVYQLCNVIPAYLGAPGFSSDPTVHAVMVEVTKKINGHWDCYFYADIPLTSGGSAVTIETAATWKETNGYNEANENVYFPMAAGSDGRKYHLSVLAMANLQACLVATDGIPYRSASNTPAPIIENLYLGDSATGRVYDDEKINNSLNRNGINSAAFVGGRWAIWGCHPGAYSATSEDKQHIFDTATMMLYYLSNDFQFRHAADVDQPMTINGLRAIVVEEQSRVDVLISIGALTFGEVSVMASEDNESDIVNGDFRFSFRVTTTPLAKSLTAVVEWTDEGFRTWFESFNQE